MTKLSAFRGLYAIVDSVVHAEFGLERLLRQIILESSIPVLQFRWKTIDGKSKLSLLDLAGRLKAERDIVVIVNDDSEYLDHPAVDGLHLGQKDIALEMVRKIHPEKLYGLSTHDMKQARNGGKIADYIGCGSVYPTATKASASAIGYDVLCAMVREATVPTVAIGGISAGNIQEVARSGCSMAAVIAGLIEGGSFQGQKLHELFLHG